MELVGGGFDLALRTTELADTSLVARKIALQDWYVIASPEYLARFGTPECPHDLSRHRCLVTGIEPIHRWQLHFDTGVETVKITGIPIANLTAITREAVIAGLGITLLPEYCITQNLAAGRLQRILPEYTAERRWVYAVYPQVRNLPLKTRLFIDFLAERLRSYPWSGSPERA